MIQNSKKLFAEIISCTLALVGVVIHCSLRGVIPWVRSRSNFQYVAVTETVVSNIVQLISLQTKSHHSTEDSNVTHNKNAPVILQPQQMLILLIDEVNALHIATLSDRSPNSNNAISNLIDSIRLLMKSSIQQDFMKNDQFSYTLEHRNALFSLQLVLVTLFSDSALENIELESKFNQILSNAESDVFGIMKSSESSEDSPVLSSDVDELLLIVCPQVVPAILSCHLFRQVIERNLKKVRFVQELQSSSESVSDLQFLNMNLPNEVDIAVAKHHVHLQQHQQLNQQEEEEEETESDRAIVVPVGEDPTSEVVRPKSRIEIEIKSPSLLPVEYPAIDVDANDEIAFKSPKHEEKDTIRSINKSKKTTKKSAPVRKGLHSVIIAPISGPLSDASPKRKVRIEAKLAVESVASSRLNLNSPAESRIHRGPTELQNAHTHSSNSTIKRNNANEGKSSKSAHLKWIMDMEMYMQSVSKNLFQLIKPYAFNPPPLLDRIIQSVSTLTLSTGLVDTNNSEKQSLLRFPLPSSLAYRILNHIDNIRVLVMGHHTNGEQRIKDTTLEFIDIMSELRKTKDKVWHTIISLIFLFLL